MAQALRYRKRIFDAYASGVQHSGPVFDEAAAAAWAVPYRTYLRGWLPNDKGAAILDVACGGGRLLYLLKTLGYRQLDGVDISPEQVTLAKQVARNVTLGEGGEFLQRNQGTFDVVFAIDIIEHLEKDEVLAFLDGCRDALRKDGRIVLQTPNADSPFFGSMRYADFTHETCFTEQALRTLLEMAGFVEIEARECAPVSHGVVARYATAR